MAKPNARTLTYRGQSFRVVILPYGHFRTYWQDGISRDDIGWNELRRTIQAWADYLNS